MNRIMVLMTLADGAIEKIKSNPELPRKEMEFVNLWKAEGLLESFYITASKSGAVLVFSDMDAAKAKELIEILPYFPFMSKVEYLTLDKQF